MLNTTLLKAANAVMGNTTAAQMYISAKFFSSEASSVFTFFPLIISEVIIDRNYAYNYADAIDLHMKVSLKDAALMQDQGENLRCILTVNYVDSVGTLVTNPKPVQTQYVAMINNPRDIRKAVPDVQKYTEPTYDMTVRLVEDEIYAARKTKLNLIMQTMTVKQAIYALSSMVGITKVHLIDPDNTHLYDHIVIPPYTPLSALFNHLQSSLGVYTKGISYYVTGGVLYIWPPFETNPKYDKTASFYQVDKGRYAGSDIFHRMTGNDIGIVINTEVHSYDLTIAGAENMATGFTFNRASRARDGFTTIDPKLGAQFTDQPNLMVTFDSARSATSGSTNLVHLKSTDNVFPKMSEICSTMASLATFQWTNADPFRIDPCQAVAFYYDHNSAMMKKTGLFESVKYRISKIKRMHDKDVFGCSAAVTLRLSPNETKVI